MAHNSTGRDRFWQAHVTAWGRSGLTQREYCKRQGLGEWSFSSWKRRLDTKRQGGTAASGASFVPVHVRSAVTLPSPSCSSWTSRSPLTLLVGERYRVEVGDGFSVETLGRLLAALGGR